MMRSHEQAGEASPPVGRSSLPLAAAVQCALMCLLALPSLAAESNQDRGKRIVDEALAAIGGKNFLGLRDLVVSGRAYSFYREELSGLSIAKIYTRYLIRPEPPVAGFFGLRERESFGKKEESSVVFTEKDAYEITFRGARPIPEDRYNRFRESTLRDVLYILRQRLGEPGLTIESRHTDVIDNQPVEIVDISDSDNRIVTVYFQRSTKLPIRQVTERRDPKTNERNEEVTVYSKFRDVGGGVMWPFAVQRERNGEKIFSMFAESVKINQDLTDNLFTLPADMKILGGPKKAIELKK